MAWKKQYIKKASGKEGRYSEVEVIFAESSLDGMRTFDSKSSGEKFYAFKISPRKEPDIYGNTHSVYTTIRADDEPKSTLDKETDVPNKDTDDLPF